MLQRSTSLLVFNRVNCNFVSNFLHLSKLPSYALSFGRVNLMTGLIFFPIIFLKFWFFEAPRAILHFFASLNRAFFQLFSLPLLLKTYFKPWKNEYRQGLVGFSIAMGIFIKTFVILADLLLFLFLLIIELAFFLMFIFWPFATVYLLFI